MDTSSPTKASHSTAQLSSPTRLSSTHSLDCSCNVPQKINKPQPTGDTAGFNLHKNYTAPSTAPPSSADGPFHERASVPGAEASFLRTGQAPTNPLAPSTLRQGFSKSSSYPLNDCAPLIGLQQTSCEPHAPLKSDAPSECATDSAPDSTAEGEKWGSLPPHPLSRSACSTTEPIISRINFDGAPRPFPEAEPREIFDPFNSKKDEKVPNGTSPHSFETTPSETSNGAASDGETDETLLLRLQAREHSALAKLWARYAPLLYSQSLKILHNPSECEDVVAEAFSEVWQRAANYHAQRAKPAAWLVTLVRRRAIDRLRERRSFERAEERLTYEFARRAPSNSAEEHLRLADLRWLLDQALNKLTEQQRQTVSMVYFQGLTQREISERTHTPIGTIKTRLEIALRKMRERIRGTRLRTMLPCRVESSPSASAAGNGLEAHIEPKAAN